MGTAHTGIPMLLRNIQPPPSPVCGFQVNKIVLNAFGETIDDETTFYLGISSDSGFSASGVPLSQERYLYFNKLKYGHYSVNEGIKPGYINTSIIPYEFDLSASNPFQIVTITNVLAAGIITVTKTIIGVVSDETYFDITLTGQGADPIEQSGQVRIGEPLVFYDLPLDDYVIHEGVYDPDTDTWLMPEGYTNSSITPSTITIDADNLLGTVEVVNAVVLEDTLELTFDDIANAPVEDVSSVSDWNTRLYLGYGEFFTSVVVVGNMVRLLGGNPFTLWLHDMSLITIGLIGNFSNLVRLICYNCQLTNLPTLPDSLPDLECWNNQLTTLPALPSSLTTLNCGTNQLTELPPLPSSLTSLICYYNPLTSLPSLPSSLISLVVGGNLFTSLPTLPSSLTVLQVSDSQLTEIPILPNGLVNLSWNNNPYVALPTLPNSLMYLYCNSNPYTTLPALPSSLTTLNCSNNQLTSLPTLPSSLTTLNCSNNQLTGLPTLPSGLVLLDCGYNSFTNIEVDSILTELISLNCLYLETVYLNMTFPAIPTPSVVSNFMAAYPSIYLSIDLD